MLKQAERKPDAPGKRSRSARTGDGRRMLVPIAVLGGLALLALAVAAVATFEVVRKGQLFSYSSGRIYEIRVLDLVNLYVEPEVVTVDDVLDLFSGSILSFLAGIAVLAFALLRALGGSANRRLRTFFGLAALGAAYLALDELYGIHESLGHNLRFLGEIPGNRQPDGAIVVAYLVPVGIYLWAFRDLLLSSRGAKRLFAAGLGLGLLAVAIDVVDGPAEELFESLAALTFLIGYVVLTADLVAGALQGRAVAPQRS